MACVDPAISFWAGRTHPPALEQNEPNRPPGLIDFATRYLGLELDPLQTRILTENPDRAALLCSRQWGKSFLGAVRALWLAHTRPGSVTAVVSHTREQARNLLLTIRGLAQRALEDIPCHGSRDAIRLPNGSSILACPSSPGSLNHLSVQFLIVDEAASVDDAAIVSAASALASTGGHFWLLSGAGRPTGYFFRAVTAGLGGFTVYQATAAECPRIPQDFLQLERKTLTEEQFAAVYLCQFTGGAPALYPRAILDSLYRVVDPAVSEDHYFLGLDLGQSINHSALVVLRCADVVNHIDPATGSASITRHLIIHHVERFPLGTDWQHLARLVNDAIGKINDYDRTRLVLDFTGIGNPVHRTFVEERLYAPITRITITGGKSSYQRTRDLLSVPRTHLLANIQSCLEQGRLTLSPKLSADLARPLLDELQSFRPDYTSSSSTDLVFALALALWPATHTS